MTTLDIVSSIAVILTMLLIWRWRAGPLRRWLAAGLKAKIADYRAGAKRE